MIGDIGHFTIYYAPAASRKLYLIENHEKYTGSTVARHILDNWTEELGRFKKVFPTDYKRVLAEMAAEAEPRLKVV